MKKLDVKKEKGQPEKSVKSARYAHVTLVLAPEIPCSEVSALEKHYQEAIDDPNYSVIVNYDLYTKDAFFNVDEEFVVLTAPGLPLEELRKFRKKFDRAVRLSKKTKGRVYIFANYDVTVETRLAAGSILH